MSASHSSSGFFHNWAKERADEMDAALTSLEGKVGEINAEGLLKANRALADLRKTREEFLHDVKEHAKSDDAAWGHAKARLEAAWARFESDVEKYVDSFGGPTEPQATFKHQASAQLKAWREAADKFHAAAADYAAERRKDIDESVTRMKADATAAEKKLEKFHQAGAQSTSALMHALSETRAVFDRANQSVRDAFKKAAA